MKTVSPADDVAMMQQLIQLACRAGAAIMQVYRCSVAGVTSKADGSPLTAADLIAQRTIIEGLARIAPGIPVLSEEAANIPYAERASWKRFWLVDPLDGTREFIERNGEFTVNIALVENGEPVFGVVYAPVTDVAYHAARGTGAFMQRGNQAVRSISVKLRGPGEALRVVVSRSHSDARTEALLGRLGNHQCIAMGSSLKLCLVAEGAAHFYPRLGPTMEWDTAAAHAIVSEAGGRVCDLSGLELRYNKQDLHNPGFFVLAAADRALWAQLEIARSMPAPAAD